MCVRSAFKNFIMPGIDRLNRIFDEHVSAVKSLEPQAPQMRPGQSTSFSHVNGLMEIR